MNTIIKQRSPEWYQQRYAGIPTCSQFARVMPVTKSTLATGAGIYIAELVCQMAGHWEELPDNYWMKRGREMEPQAVAAYEFITNTATDENGFIVSECGRCGGSPDRLVGDVGTFEVKCPAPHTHYKYLIDQRVPNEYLPQVNGHIYVTGREWCDFMSWFPGAPPLIVRVNRSDEKWQDWAKRWDIVLDKFHAKLEKAKAIAL